MNSHPHRSSPAAFTLVELLVVIAIIAILMGLLFPAIGMVKDAARRAEAKAAATGIVAAVKAYNTEYGKYPNVSTTTPSTTEDSMVGENAGGATTSNAALFYVLRAREDTSMNPTHKYNPRKIIFFEGKAASDPKVPKSGFSDGTGAALPGAFFDPWGNQYCVVIDTTYDNQLQMNSQSYSDYQSPNLLQTGVGAYSLGKDGKIGNNGDKKLKNGSTASDDVVSWQ